MTSSDAHASFEQRLDYIFKDKALLQQALTHPSATKSRKDRGYERLEFLGDRVLGLAMAEMLFTSYPDENEGQIAKRHAALVRKETCAMVAHRLGFAGVVEIAGMEHDHAHELVNETVLADACEALVGAMYLDGGLNAAQVFIMTHWQPVMDAAERPPQDAKSALQEWAQGRGMNRPVYELIEHRGPDHLPFFRVQVTLQGTEPGLGEASSKKKAEQLAAEQVLKAIAVW
jgi:ribonuclease III